MMKNMLIACAVIFFGCNDAASNAEDPVERSTQASSISSNSTAQWPDKLLGRWEGIVEGNRYVEEWKRGCGNHYDGRSEMWKGDTMLGSESMRISEFAGHWMFMANPDGEHVTAFQLEQKGEGSWTFANEEHDFPQRISYNLNGENLNAWIEGPGQNGTMRMSFDLRRVKG